MGKEGDVRGGEAGAKGDAACGAKGEVWLCARPLSCLDGRLGGVSDQGWGVDPSPAQLLSCGSPQKESQPCKTQK